MVKIDYDQEANNYIPKQITKLLIGEARPPDETHYFYIPCQMKQYEDIKDDQSLPATIFYHYFQKIPKDMEEYKKMLEALRDMGIFLVDIYENPIRVRGNKVNQERVKNEIKNLRGRLKDKGIDIEGLGEENIIFLLARNGYVKEINKYFQVAKKIKWIDFRLSKEHQI